MAAELPRWFMIFVLIALIVGLLIWARGTDHHRGQYVGALGVPTARALVEA